MTGVCPTNRTGNAGLRVINTATYYLMANGFAILTASWRIEYGHGSRYEDRHDCG